MKRKCGALGQFAGDGERAVERHAGIQQRREFLGEEQNVAPRAAGRTTGSLSSKRLLLRRDARRRPGVSPCSAAVPARPSFSVSPDAGCRCAALPSEADARKEVAAYGHGHLEFLRHAHHFVHRGHAVAHFHPAVLAQVAHAVAARRLR